MFGWKKLALDKLTFALDRLKDHERTLITLEGNVRQCFDEIDEKIAIVNGTLSERILTLELALGNLLTAVEQDVFLLKTKFTVNGKPLKDYVRDLRK